MKMEALYSPSPLSLCTVSISSRTASAAVSRMVCSRCVAAVRHEQRRTSRKKSDKSSTTRTNTARQHTSTTGGRAGQSLNLEISPHRAVSAVRLMRIQFGGAFADLLNEQGKGSGDNEMGYVERTLGFRTRYLEDRDLRLVTEIVGVPPVGKDTLII